ncbi:hypothetical protein ACTPOK_20135 [Streptomyces inhibens]|uniref:hypothetical protein n=1 Tax=Streptomyces inhibens TaxID=2293571 RepID=UPI00402A72F6
MSARRRGSDGLHVPDQQASAGPWLRCSPAFHGRDLRLEQGAGLLSDLDGQHEAVLAPGGDHHPGQAAVDGGRRHQRSGPAAGLDPAPLHEQDEPCAVVLAKKSGRSSGPLWNV